MIPGMARESGGWWRWPDGLAWRWALAAGRRSRREKYAHFLRTFALSKRGKDTTILDVGVTRTPAAQSRGAGSANFLELWYSHPDSLTACGLEGRPEVCERRGIRFVEADGCDLPFADGEFDVAFSNAVLEHVGSRERQRRFVAELSRVGKAVWLATPNAASPLEFHTLLPCAHWLPRGMMAAVYRAAGRGFFAEEVNLNLLSAGDLRGLFPPALRESVRIHTQYFLGFPAQLIATVGG
jgi:hypothetical protein